MSVGSRIYLKRQVTPADIVDGFSALPSANVADSMNRLNSLDSRIRRMGPRLATPMAGVALTARVSAGDNLLLHKALDIAVPGDVIIVSNVGADSQALMGEVMFGYAKSRGVAGIVFDGPVRDIDSLDSLGLPVFATGLRPGGPFKNGPGELNVPIACGGVSVSPGDVILADNDGVVVIPRTGAADVLQRASVLSKKDQAKVAAGLAGTLDRSWVDPALEAAGCEQIDDFHE
ncbi:RraA family protein [Labrenzia sp. OB1]|uniref:RraA family protein n=1 Tax=Labrenzia sp. OB1 TaxID=1561204 RepID=UPI0007B1F209|nr:RraA family protein [Labrenzia sp. OB1]KZM50526.1 dimethylmenaquinone methyltransferase [Labrenzia sp. OB1]